MLLLLQHFNSNTGESNGLNGVIYIQTLMLQKARGNSVVSILQIPKRKLQLICFCWKEVLLGRAFSSWGRAEVPYWDWAQLSQLIACKERNLPVVFEVCPRRGEDVWRLHFSPIKRRVTVQGLPCVYICAYGKMLSKFSILYLISGKWLCKFW